MKDWSAHISPVLIARLEVERSRMLHMESRTAIAKVQLDLDEARESTAVRMERSRWILKRRADHGAVSVLACEMCDFTAAEFIAMSAKFALATHLDEEHRDWRSSDRAREIAAGIPYVGYADASPDP